MASEKFIDELNEIYENAKESLIKTIRKNGGSIQFKSDNVKSFRFYSDCNGVVDYNVARVFENEIYCTTEGETWNDDYVIEEDSNMIEAFMSIDELDKFSLCQLTDRINRFFGDNPTMYEIEFHSVYLRAIDMIEKSGGYILIGENALPQSVEYIDEDYNLSIANFRMVTKFSIITTDWREISISNIPMDSFVKMIDTLIEKFYTNN